MKRTDINIRDPFVLVHEGAYHLYGTRGATCWGPADGFDVYVSHDLENWEGPVLWRTQDGTLLCLWASFSEGGYTEGVAVSDNGEIDGNFTQAEPLFMDDGGHGMVFRGLDGQLYLTKNPPETRRIPGDSRNIHYFL